MPFTRPPAHVFTATHDPRDRCPPGSPAPESSAPIVAETETVDPASVAPQAPSSAAAQPLAGSLTQTPGQEDVYIRFVFPEISPQGSADVNAVSASFDPILGTRHTDPYGPITDFEFNRMLNHDSDEELEEDVTFVRGPDPASERMAIPARVLQAAGDQVARNRAEVVDLTNAGTLASTSTSKAPGSMPPPPPPPRPENKRRLGKIVARAAFPTITPINSTMVVAPPSLPTLQMSPASVLFLASTTAAFPFTHGQSSLPWVPRSLYFALPLISMNCAQIREEDKWVAKRIKELKRIYGQGSYGELQYTVGTERETRELRERAVEVERWREEGGRCMGGTEGWCSECETRAVRRGERGEDDGHERNEGMDKEGHEVKVRPVGYFDRLEVGKELIMDPEEMGTAEGRSRGAPGS